MRKITMSLLLGVSFFIVTVASSSVIAKDTRPNVVIIITDDQNDYGFYDVYPGTEIPAIDEFRKTAVTFKHAYTASPVCGPSRAAFFSGLYPHTTGAYRNGSDPWRKSELLRKAETMPELFKRAGYTTFGNGKLYHAKLEEGREKKSWHNKPFAGGFGPYPPVKDRIAKEGEPAELKGAQKFWGVTEWTDPDSDFPDVVNADKSIEFLKQDHDKPFFMVYGLWRPHTPFTAPKRFFDMYDPKKITLPRGYLDGDLSDIPPYGQMLSKIWGERWLNAGKGEEENWKRILHGYLAATTFADWNVGRVIDAVNESRYADNTIILIWSDNGFHMGEKNHYEKATLWEAAAHVPMIMRLPKFKNKGKVVKQPVSTVDVYPTLVEYCDLPKLDHVLEGKSLKPLLEKPSRRWDRPAITSYGEQAFSARDERYRYIRYPSGLEELYDHKNDPFEFQNLANDPKMKKVKERLNSWNPKQWAKSLGGRKG